jgi:arginase
MERRLGIPRQRDHAHARMVAAESGDRADTVEERHVEVDHDRVRTQLLAELDRHETVRSGADDSELGLLLDQRPQGLDERFVVVGEQDADRSAGHRACVHAGRKLAFLLRSVQPRSHTIAVIGAALDLGAGRRGVDMGPSAIRYADLAARLAELGYETVDLGNVEAPVAEATASGDEHAHFLREIKATCLRIAERVAPAASEGLVPLVLGGDHSVALGSLTGLARARGVGGVLWLDAHGDLNSPSTSPSGNVHGMVLAAAMGVAGPAFVDGWELPAVDPHRVALVGIRSLDAGERELVRDLGMKVFTMTDVDRHGLERCLDEALAHVDGPNFVHVSLDMDVVDPDVAPGVGTPVRGGLNYREAHLALELVAEAGIASSLDVVEVNPILDRENATGQLAVELAASALGARIL